jgi:hypothetical protein
MARPKKSDVRLAVSIRLPSELWGWLREQGPTVTVVIEQLVRDARACSLEKGMVPLWQLEEFGKNDS